MQKIDFNNKTILVTGHAGFIGSNLVYRLFHEMKSGTIVGVDNLNNYYDPSLKIYRLDELDNAKPTGIEYKSIRGSIADKELIDKLFAEYKFDIVVNLAAQAGVRYSIENPDVYIESNVIGFYNILEACRASQKFSVGSELHAKKEMLLMIGVTNQTAHVRNIINPMIQVGCLAPKPFSPNSSNGVFTYLVDVQS